MPKLLTFITNPRRLLPLMVAVGALIAVMRIGDVWDSLSSGRLFAPPAMAQTASTAPASSTAAPAITPPAMTPPPSPDNTAAPPSDTDLSDMSPAEMDVLKQLAARRDQLDKRAKELDEREAILKVAEQRVDKKVKELEALKTQLQAMVGQANAAQSQQLANLVKIYETMKPDDAARIFDTLDMPVLIGVVQLMKPARTAPIMAAMSPDKAKALTLALTKQNSLP